VLLAAADAAYAARSYRVAASRYAEFLSKYKDAPQAPRAALGLGWAEYRDGDRQRARRSWVMLADRFPSDPRAPIALALAAESAAQSGDVGATETLLDRIVTRYPSAPEAGIARLDRSIVALRRHREEPAMRDLDHVIRTNGVAAIRDRGDLVDALTPPSANAAAPASRALAQNALSTGEPLETFAAAFVAQDPRNAPYVLHGVALLVALDRGWADPLVGNLVNRIVAVDAAYPPAPELLAKVGAAAASAGQWPVARQAYQALFARYPGTATARRSEFEFADALFRTGSIVEARAQAERAVSAGGANGPRALLLLAEIGEASGDETTALGAYDRLLRDYPKMTRSPQSLLAHARLLQHAGQMDRARSVLQTVVARADGEVAAEASYRLAQTLSAAGQHAAAVEWYMTAAYIDGSRWTSQALLGAGDSLTALKETNEAVAVYRKLVPARDTTVDRPEDRAAGGEAAYRIADILRRAGRHEEALEMYLAAAHFTAGSSGERRALVGALQCMVATGDRASAEVIYRRLLASSATEPQLLAEARRALRTGASDRGSSESALPKSAR
jgi:TolA-binding protein